MKRDLVLEQLVIEEANNLKIFATEEELNNLNYETLSGTQSDLCVYGKLTGCCYNERAYDLIRLCATRVYDVVSQVDKIKNGVLGGPPTELYNCYDRKFIYCSPIEKLLFLYKPCVINESDKVKKLVDFLQGKTETLIF